MNSHPFLSTVDSSSNVLHWHSTLNFLKPHQDYFPQRKNLLAQLQLRIWVLPRYIELLGISDMIRTKGVAIINSKATMSH